MTTENKKHILEIIAADLDGLDIEYYRRDDNEWVESRGLTYNYAHLQDSSERYRIKPRTVTGALYRFNDGDVRIFVIGKQLNVGWELIEGTEHEFTLPPEDTPKQEGVEMVEYEATDSVGGRYWMPKDARGYGPLTENTGVLIKHG